MKKFLVIFLFLIFVSPVFSEVTTKKTNNLPDGVFRRSHSGDIVQYDKNGKKIGVYKVVKGKFVKVK